MKELIILEFQAKHIEDTLRKVNNAMESHKKETCIGRDIMQAWEMILNVIAETPNKHVKR